MLFKAWILSAFLSAFIASLCRIVGMTKLELSHAHAFMSLSSVFVIVLSGLFFHEAITLPRVIGVLLTMIGIVVGSQG